MQASFLIRGDSESITALDSLLAKHDLYIELANEIIRASEDQPTGGWLSRVVGGKLSHLIKMIHELLKLKGEISIEVTREHSKKTLTSEDSEKTVSETLRQKGEFRLTIKRD